MVIPLVCKRWARLATNSVDQARCRIVGDRCAVTLLSLYSWLAKHRTTGILQKLAIVQEACPDLQDDAGGAAGQQQWHALCALLEHAVLPACSRLRKLRLSLEAPPHAVPFTLGPCGAELITLHSLRIHSTGGLLVTAQLQGLTRLAKLELLTRDTIEWGAGATLPPLLTHLSLVTLEGGCLPQQVGARRGQQACF